MLSQVRESLRSLCASVLEAAMAGQTFYLTQVPMFPGGTTSVLGTPLMPLQVQAAAGSYLPPLPGGNRFLGRPVVIVDLSLAAILPCGQTDARVEFEVPTKYLDSDLQGGTLGGTVVQKMTMGWMVADCRSFRVLSAQPLTTFWEGFEVLAGHSAANQVDEWWLNAPPAGDGTFGFAYWEGRAAFFSGLTPKQCGLIEAGKPGSEPLSGNKPSSRVAPSVWANEPLPENNVAYRRLARNWFCCKGLGAFFDPSEYHVADVSTRWTIPEGTPPGPWLLAGSGRAPSSPLDSAQEDVGSVSGMQRPGVNL